MAIEAGAGDDAQASEAVEAVLTGPEIEIAFNPTVPARRPRRRRHALQPDLVHPGLASRRCSRARPRRTARPTTSYRYVLMPVRFAVLTHRSLSRRTSGCRGRSLRCTHLTVAAPHTTRSHEMQLGSGRSGQDGRQHARADPPRRARGRRATTATQTSPTSRSLADLVKAARRAAGRLGDGAARRPDPRHGRQAGRACSTRATWSSTAATASSPTTSRTRSCSRPRASATSTAVSPAASGASTTATA